jgi:phosphoribosylformylglycinamidine (FGAM) synthase PurS component
MKTMWQKYVVVAGGNKQTHGQVHHHKQSANTVIIKYKYDTNKQSCLANTVIIKYKYDTNKQLCSANI